MLKFLKSIKLIEWLVWLAALIVIGSILYFSFNDEAHNQLVAWINKPAEIKDVLMIAFGMCWFFHLGK
jgi:hypothetical protein